MFSFKELTEQSIPEENLITTPNMTSAIGCDNGMKVKFDYDIEMLDLLCQFVLTVDSFYINRAAMQNIDTMLNISDLNRYTIDDRFNSRFSFISLALEARLKHGLEKKSLILDYVKRHINDSYTQIIEDEVLDGIDDMVLSQYTIKYINTKVFENLIHGHSIGHTERILDLLTKKESGGFKSISEFSEKFESFLKEATDDIRTSKRYNMSSPTIDLKPDNFKNGLRSSVSRMKLPSNKWKTGSKLLNNMLNGGIESSRVYLFLAITGGGKSVILLTLALWVRQFNHSVTKDPTKRATVLYLTLENTFDETIERVWNILVTADDIRNYDINEVEELMKSKGGLNLELENSINLCIKYFNDGELSVADIRTIIDEMNDEGDEVVAVFVDYIQRLKPDKKYSELRFELAGDANCLHVLANDYCIPVVTAAQLNRAASQTVENAIVTNKKDCIRLLGKSNTGESWGMIQNVDVAIIVGKEVIDDDPDDIIEVMGFNKIKYRGKPAPNEVMYFVHPYRRGNGISLETDVDSKESKSKFSVLDFYKPKFEAQPTNRYVSDTEKSLRRENKTEELYKTFNPSVFDIETFESSCNSLETEIDRIRQDNKITQESNKVRVESMHIKRDDDGLKYDSRNMNYIVSKRDNHEYDNLE